MSTTRRSILLAAAALIAAPGAKAAAGDFPGRPIKLIVSGGAGSYPDKLGRRIAERFTADMGQQVNVFNMPGTGIGMTALTRSEPDGHTIALATMAQMVFAPYLYRKLPYDPLKHPAGDRDDRADGRRRPSKRSGQHVARAARGSQLGQDRHSFRPLS